MTTTTISPDLSSVSVTADETLECALPNYNPETMVPFGSEAEVRAYVATIVGREYFWIPKLSDEEKAAIATEAKSNEIRAERNARLAASDWTQVADAPVDKQAWADYRQALREVPQQEGFPWDVQWPEQP